MIDDTGQNEDRLFAQLAAESQILWINPALSTSHDVTAYKKDIADARRRLHNAHYHLQRSFPGTRALSKVVESPLFSAEDLAKCWDIPRWLVKADHCLPIAGSIKARGGFNEVLAFAESVATENGLPPPSSGMPNYTHPDARRLFSHYSVVVGSTGNLGLSIGMIASSLGFRTAVHMSRDAKSWKKDLLREKGVEVIEHAGDYSVAVEQGRESAKSDPKCHFVDDEHSVNLFAGYGAAAAELASQLEQLQVVVDDDHPLFVYVPCGVGGAPGGITYGLKALFGRNVHCFWAEPSASPCMLLQLLSGVHRPVSVYEIGLDNVTEADGLAVGRASPFVAPLMADLVSGIYTANDGQMLDMMLSVRETESMQVEPSAAISFFGPLFLTASDAGRRYCRVQGIGRTFRHATHVSWTTGGSLVPVAEWGPLYERAKAFRGQAKALANGWNR
ncbi:D-serine ammonia-lyase [Sinorhizobium sp. 7-81]|uniref:D-serine ammonia-lyase n=1 Tax=Sinorhizobium sp. 8-89 TaxID=3049089 RepID=UPI0024C4239B|nr:D-serine ammonia-lyase [Sinorhizobium sp. 8-89]MDK1494663.1 D-serine ammonia-lyase [Sinorhizobium sp. 8-89]